MPATVIKAFAKINLGLRILGRRADGFHELRTVFQTISLADRVQVELAKGAGVRLILTRRADLHKSPEVVDLLDVPDGASNLAWRAAELGRDAFGIRGQVVVTLEKRIPTRAGLGGGSSDAAAVLRLLALRAERRPSTTKLLAIAAELGSDVPAFMMGGTVLGLGRGEEVYPLPDLPRWNAVVVLASTGISTPEAYRLWDESNSPIAVPGATQHESTWRRHESTSGGQPPAAADPPEADTAAGDQPGPPASDVGSMGWEQREPSPAKAAAPLAGRSGLTASDRSSTIYETCSTLLQLLKTRPNAVRRRQLPASRRGRDRGAESVSSGEAPNVRAGFENDFESVVFPLSPDFPRLRHDLIRSGAVFASLSGSGAAQFGLYADRQRALSALKRLASANPAWAVRFVTRRECDNE